ncbi:MAG: HAD-IG family 5'-nucleotidase [Pseudobdellovibrionaceae bacterium]
MTPKVYVNRTLNLKKIKYIGFDMDHTLIRYKTANFEALSHRTMIEKLVTSKGYPDYIRKLPFDNNFAVRGLAVDKKHGNLLKVNRHSAIRASFHGTKVIDFKTQQKLYKSTYIDLSDKEYMAVDTAFSLSLATLYAQLVDLKDANPEAKFPDYSALADDVLFALDESHRDGSLKTVVRSNLDEYILKDPETVAGLERYKKHGKKLFIATNSDFHYSKLLLDYAINPFLKEHKSWMDVFEFVITLAQKPRFFYDESKYLKINPADGTMTNYGETLKPGIYQGGNAMTFANDMKIEGDDILYIGDHIYGDILRLKKDCNWRTAMVIEELDEEVENDRKADPINDEIEKLMKLKEPFEDSVTEMMTRKIETGVPVDEAALESIQDKIGEIDSQISGLIKKQQAFYNSNWGQLMRAGNEESYFAHQVERYACIYMAKISDLLALSPRTYFRAPRKMLSHEIEG